MHTVLFEGVGVVISRSQCASRIFGTYSVMIVPLFGVAVCAIIQDPVYSNFADDLPVVSLNIEVRVLPHVPPFVNLDVDGSC